MIIDSYISHHTKSSIRKERLMGKFKSEFEGLIDNLMQKSHMRQEQMAVRKLLKHFERGNTLF